MGLSWFLLFLALSTTALCSDEYTEAAVEPTLDPENSTNGDEPERLPGFEIKVTQQGFNYAAQIAIDTLMLKLRNLTIPDMREEVGPATVGIHSVKVVSFPRPRSGIRILPGKGLRWRAGSLNPTITANYEALVSLGFWDVNKEGIMTIEGKELQFALDFFVGRDSQGRPTVTVFDCTANGDIGLKFEGGWSDPLNLGSRMFKRKIKSVILDQVCALAKSEINEKAGWALSHAKLVQDIPPEFEIDFSLVRSPAFNNHSAHAYHKGAFYYKPNKQDPPFEPAAIPFFPRHRRKMVYVYITSYMLNSAFHAIYANNFMAINVSSEEVPSNVKEYFAASCAEDKMCLGRLIPELADHYPNSETLLRVSATHAPKLTIDSGNIRLDGSARAHVYALEDDTPVKILSVAMNVTGTVRVVVRNGVVMFNVSVLRSQANVEYSKMGTTDSEVFETVVNKATNEFILPLLKELGGKGITLPKLDSVRLVKPQIINVNGLKDVMIIASSFKIVQPANITGE